MKKWYSWEAIVQQYETLFLTGEEERENDIGLSSNL